MKKLSLTHYLYIDTHGVHWLETAEGAGQILHREHIRFSKTSVSGAGPEVQQASPGAAQVTSWLKSPQMKTALSEILKKIPSKKAEISLCFSETLSIFRFFTMPPVDRIYRKKAIPIEARKHVPFPLEECLYDWKVNEMKVEGKVVMGVLFGALRREVYDAALALCAGVGLKPATVDVLPIAVSRSIERLAASSNPQIPIAKENILTVYLDSEQIQMTLLSQMLPILSRSIYLNETPVKGSFILERRKLDLQTTLDFVRRQFGIQKTDRILLLGSPDVDAESLSAWAKGLSEELGTKVEILPSIKPGLPDGAGKPATLSGWSELALLGLSLRDSTAALGAYTLDLMTQLTEVPMKSIALKKIWTGALAFSLLFAAFAVWRFVEAGMLDSKLVSMRRGQGQGELHGKNVAEIKMLISQQSGGLQVIRQMMDPQNRFYLTPLMQSLSESIPPESWLESWAFKTDIDGGPAGALRAALAWRGRVYVLDGKRDFALINSFFKAMKENPALSNRFAKSDISVKREEGSTQGGFDRPTISYTMGFNTNDGVQ